MTFAGHLWNRTAKVSAVCSFVILCVLVVVAGFGYIENSGSQLLAAKYGMSRYDKEHLVEPYTGFYAKENWGKNEVYRWSGRQGEFSLLQEGMVAIQYVCSAPRLGTDPIRLEVLLDDELLDQYTFWTPQKIRRTYWVGDNKGVKELRVRVRVSRSWSPKRERSGDDSRRIGVAVSEPRYLGERLVHDVGLGGYQLSASTDGQHDSQGVLSRWTNVHAAISVDRFSESGLRLVVRSGHPELHQRPLGVRVGVQTGVERSLMFSSDQEQSIVFSAAELHKGDVMEVAVDRTWNPKREGYGDDDRDLGVSILLEPIKGVPK